VKKQISIIIPMYNAEGTLDKCLVSLKKSICGQEDIEIILVDDASTDLSVDIARKYGFIVIANKVNTGPSTCRNIGAGMASGSILLFTDSDVVWPADGLKRIRNFFNEFQDISAVMGLYGIRAGNGGMISQFRNLKHHYDLISSNEDTFVLMGSCCAIRRSAFFSVKGFDENYKKALVEDVDLGIRLWKNGYKIKLLKDLQVEHLKKYNLISMIKSDIIFRTIPWVELLLRYRFFKNDVSTKLSEIICLFSILISLVSVLIISSIQLQYLLVAVLTGILFSYFICTLSQIKFIVYTKQQYNLRLALVTVALTPIRYFFYGVGIFLGVFSYYHRYNGLLRQCYTAGYREK
jgi:GT2 family glycosyltransferase